jgi:hypothetical protein
LTCYDSELQLFHNEDQFQQSIRKLKRLKKLDIGGVNIYTSGDDLARFIADTNITSVGLSETRFSDVTDLLQSNKITVLCLDDIKGLDENNHARHSDFVVLKSHHVLQDLSLADVPYLGDYLLTRKLSRCPSLTAIDLSRCNLTDYAVNMLFKLPALRRLVLDGNEDLTFSSDKLVPSSSSEYESDSEYQDEKQVLLKYNTSLEYLSLMHILPCDEAITYLSQHPKLAYLNLFSNHNTMNRSLNNDQFVRLLKTIRLKYLDVQGHVNITSTDQVVQVLKDCQVSLRLNRTGIDLTHHPITTSLQ